MLGDEAQVCQWQGVRGAVRGTGVLALVPARGVPNMGCHSLGVWCGVLARVQLRLALVFGLVVRVNQFQGPGEGACGGD